MKKLIEPLVWELIGLCMLWLACGLYDLGGEVLSPVLVLGGIMFFLLGCFLCLIAVWLIAAEYTKS